MKCLKCDYENEATTGEGGAEDQSCPSCGSTDTAPTDAAPAFTAPSDIEKCRWCLNVLNAARGRGTILTCYLNGNGEGTFKCRTKTGGVWVRKFRVLWAEDGGVTVFALGSSKRWKPLP